MFEALDEIWKRNNMVPTESDLLFGMLLLSTYHYDVQGKMVTWVITNIQVSTIADFSCYNLI